MTHDDLIPKAERYLMKTIGCGFVLSELASVANEHPDAWGFRMGATHLVECKISRADFHKDKKKHFRRMPALGMGNYRYMMVPKDLLSPDEMPKSWGLIYVYPKAIRLIKKPVAQMANLVSERLMMASALRRVHLRGDLPKIYESTFNDEKRNGGVNDPY